MNTAAAVQEAVPPQPLSHARAATHRSGHDRVAFQLALLVAVAVHWVPHYPGNVDFAQHAAQIRMLHEWFSGTLAYRDRLELNWFTPYLPAYIVGVVVSTVMPVIAAVKLVWTIAAAGTVLAGVRVRERLGGSPHWDWLMLPGLFGEAYHWGLLTFALAVPLALLVYARWVSLPEVPSRRRSVTMGVAVVAVFFAHSLVAAWLMLVIGSVVGARVAMRIVSVRDALRAALPVILPVPVILAWLVAVSSNAQVQRPPGWLPLSYRLGAFFQLWTGVPFWIEAVSVASGVVLLAPFVSGVRLRRDAEAVVPLLVTLVIVVLGPMYLLGNAATSSRFAILFGPCLAWAMDSRNTVARWRTLARVMVASGAIACIGIALLCARRFSAEQRDFARVVRTVPPGCHVLSIVPDASSQAYGSPFPYQHFPVWYQAEAGGLVEFNFASLYNMIVRLRPPYRNAVPPRFAVDTAADARSLDLRTFSYVVARGPASGRAPAYGVAGPVVAHDGRWWIYHVPASTDVVQSSASPATCR